MEFEAHLGKGTGQLTLETYADEPSRGSLGATAPASDETSPGEKMPDAADFDSNLKRYDAAWNRAKKQLVQRIKNRLEDIKTSDLDGDEKQRRLAAIERDLLAFQNTGALPNSDDVLDVVIGVLESHQVPIANLESMRAYWSDKAVRLNDKDAITKLAALEQRLDRIVGGREQFVAGSKWAGTRQAGNVALQMHLTVRERTGTSFTGSLSQTGKFGRGDVMNIDGQLDRNMINFRTAAMIRGAERKLEFRGYLLSDRIITNVSGIAWNGNRVNNWMSLWREGAGPGQRGRRGTVSGQ